ALPGQCRREVAAIPRCGTFAAAPSESSLARDSLGRSAREATRLRLNRLTRLRRAKRERRDDEQEDPRSTTSTSGRRKSTDWSPDRLPEKGVRPHARSEEGARDEKPDQR